MIYGHTLTLGHEGEETEFDVVARTGDYDYSWSEVAVIKRQADGALFLAESSGCSCNSFEDNCTLADLVPIQTFDDALHRVDDKQRDGLKRSLAAGGEGIDIA